MASTAWPAKVCSNVGMVGAKPPAVRRRITSPPTTFSSRSSGTASTAWMPASTSSGAPRIVGCLLQIGDVHGRAHRGAAAEMGFADAGCVRSRNASTRSALMPKAALGTKTSSAVVELVDRAFIGLRELHRAADDGGQHGVEIERGIHRAQHFLQRLQFGDRAGQFRGAFPQGPEVGDAGDGDHRLFGEGLQQRDLAVGEAAGLLARSARSRRSPPVAQQRQHADVDREPSCPHVWQSRP